MMRLVQPSLVRLVVRRLSKVAECRRTERRELFAGLVVKRPTLALFQLVMLLALQRYLI